MTKSKRWSILTAGDRASEQAPNRAAVGRFAAAVTKIVTADHSGRENIHEKNSRFVPALLLTACVATPTTTPQVSQIAPDTLGLSGPAAPQFPDQWWTAFHDPQVDRLAGLLVQDNPTLAAAIARIRAAQSQYAVAGAVTCRRSAWTGRSSALFSPRTISFRRPMAAPIAGSARWRRIFLEFGFLGQAADLIAQAGDSNADAAMLDAQGGAAGSVRCIRPDLYRSLSRLGRWRHCRSDPGRAAGDFRSHPEPLQCRAGK